MIVAGLATIPNRILQVHNTIQSLLPQVDKINLSLNNYTDIPEVFKHDKIDAQLTQGTDEQKFRKVEGDIYLACDDDLIYPTNYVELIKQKLERFEIVSFHGRNFHSFPIQSYYKSKCSKYRCLDKVAQDIQVQFAGTGCMAFKPERFMLTLKDLPRKYMADIQVAIEAKKAGIYPVCLAHESGWIQYQEVPNTIYDRFKNDDFEQTALVNKYFCE